MRTDTDRKFAAIEGGGTKFVVGVGKSYKDCVTSIISTRSSHETMAEVKSFITGATTDSKLVGIGVGTFGPVTVNPADSNYGQVLSTPKPNWEGYNFVTDLGSEFNVPVAVQTDVSAAAISEAAERPNCKNLVYVTVGTGIGCGVFADGRIVSGTLHPEIGHIFLNAHSTDSAFSGVCPFHGDCLEGLASGPAIQARWGASLSELPQDHPAHEIEAYYLGSLCANLVLHHAPEVIVLGGGVMNTPGLLAKIRTQCRSLLGGYIAALNTDAAMEKLISKPLLSKHSGIQGAFMLAEKARG